MLLPNFISCYKKRFLILCQVKVAILAKDLFCMFIHRDAIKVLGKHVKNPAILTKRAWSIKDLSYNNT